MKTKVSIVIATYNRLDGLLRLLNSIDKQTRKGFDVVVVDDDSDTKVATKINNNNYQFELNVVTNNENRGPAYSRNRGVSFSSGDIILFTDDDCVLDERWVEFMSVALETASGSVVGIAGLTKGYGEDIFNIYYGKRRFLTPKDVYKSGDIADSLVTANFAILKSSFDQMGGFDTSIKIAAGEDTKLYYHIIQNDWTVLYEPNAIVYHDYPKGLRAMYNMMYKYGVGSAQIINITPANDIPYKSTKSILKGIKRELNLIRKYKMYREEFHGTNISPFRAAIFALVQNAGFFFGYQMNKNKNE